MPESSPTRSPAPFVNSMSESGFPGTRSIFHPMLSPASASMYTTEFRGKSAAGAPMSPGWKITLLFWPFL
jgi:hypothetical protein